IAGALIPSDNADVVYARLKNGAFSLNTKTGIVSKVEAIPAGLSSTAAKSSKARQLPLENGLFDLTFVPQKFDLDGYLRNERPKPARVEAKQRGSVNVKTLVTLPSFGTNDLDAEFLQVGKDGALMIYPSEEDAENFAPGAQRLYFLKAAQAGK